MRIKVTQDHIDAAVFLRDQRIFSFSLYRSLPAGEYCPIALALKTQGFPSAEVDRHHIRLDRHRRARRIKLPPLAQEMVNKFDFGFEPKNPFGRTLKPFTFELPVKS